MVWLIWSILISLVLRTPALAAGDVVGQWQGVLPVQGGLRMIVKVARADGGQLGATFVCIDQFPQEMTLQGVRLEGSTFVFGFEGAADHYEGTLSADGTTITGKWFGSVHPETPYPFDLHLASGEARWQADAFPHAAQFVPVEEGVKLEVLDWGGQGRPLMLLAGLGNDAHVFSRLASKLTGTCHVYGLTRRGFGASSAPEPTSSNYSADRLGDDVLAVMEALKLERPILVGHSIAGEELSSVGSRHPEKVAGLIYLDAAYGFAFYDHEHGSFDQDAKETARKLTRLLANPTSREGKRLARELLDDDLPQLTKSLGDVWQEMNAAPDTGSAPPPEPESMQAKISRAVLAQGEKYTRIPCPVLAIYAVPPPPATNSQDVTPEMDKIQRLQQARQAEALAAGVPSAQIVFIQNANHFVFTSNEEEVLREIRGFLAKLP